MSQIQIENAPILILTQVGRKVAQVLESLGRSAETIQEGEVGKTPLGIFLYQYFCHSHKSHTIHTCPGEKVLQGESQLESAEREQDL